MRKRRKLLFSAIASVLLLCVACNGDIFVDGVPALEENTYYLRCDGDEVSFNIPVKGLKDVSFDSEYGAVPRVSFYDKDGEYIESPTLENVAKAVYSSPMFYLEFEIDGGHVKAKALDNTTTDNVKIYVALYYEYESRIIEFVVSPGQPLEIANLSFGTVDPVVGEYTERNIPHSYINNSDQTQRVIIYPYKEAKSKIKLPVEDYEFWARGVKGVVEIPFHTGGEWIQSATNVAEVTIGGVTQFYSPDLDSEENVTVEVPPQSKVRTVTEMTYASLDVTYVAELKLPNSGLMYAVQDKCQLIQPISYKIDQKVE